jgi:hypothetical protein
VVRAKVRERHIWKRERPVHETRRASDLTPAEQENVKKALRVLKLRLGGTDALAKALKSSVSNLVWACGAKGHPSAGTAIRAARLAKVSVDDVLNGAFPKPSCCPYCGGPLDSSPEES